MKLTILQIILFMGIAGMYPILVNILPVKFFVK